MLVDADEISERKTFGGLAFLSRGYMLCGVVHDALMLRLGPTGPTARACVDTLPEKPA